MKVDEGAFIHGMAVIHGNVEVGYGSSLWPGAVLRGDYNSITVGTHTSIQDNAVVHCSPFNAAVIGNWVTVGHGCVLHGCKVGDAVVVGMRSVILDGSIVGEGTLIAAGSMIPEKAEIPPNSFVSGAPAQIRPARPGTAEKNRLGALTYYLLSRRYMKGLDTFPFEELAREIEEYKKRNPDG